MSEKPNPKNTDTPPSSDVVSEREQLVASEQLLAAGKLLLAEIAERERVLAEEKQIEVDELVKPLIKLLKGLKNENYYRMHVVITEYLSKVTDIQLYIDNVSEIYERVYGSDILNPFSIGDFCSAFAKVIQEITGKAVEIVIEGGIEDCIGRYNQSGVVVRVNGSTGNHVGSYQKGGKIYVVSNAGV